MSKSKKSIVQSGGERLDETQSRGLRFAEYLAHRKRGVEEDHDVQLRRHRIHALDHAGLPSLEHAYRFRLGSLGEHRRRQKHVAGLHVGVGIAQAELGQAAVLLALERAHLRPLDDGLGAAGDGDQDGAQGMHTVASVGDELPQPGGEEELGVAVGGDRG